MSGIALRLRGGPLLAGVITSMKEDHRKMEAVFKQSAAESHDARGSHELLSELGERFTATKDRAGPRWPARQLPRVRSTYAKASTIAVTIVAEPLKYVGVKPKVSCKAPHPSK
jgi:hypothetical protein